MKVVVLQSNYIPWKGYFELISEADVFCFYDEVKYTKNDWRNRNKIIGPNGPFWLTIPVEKDSVHKKISEVVFRDMKWVNKHLMSIKQSYAKAPFHKTVIDFLMPIYLNVNNKTLSELNKALIEEISKFIGIDTRFECSSKFNLKEGRLDRLVELLKDIGATQYLSGPAAKDYLNGNLSQFSDEGIEVSFKTYGPYRKYKQQGAAFTDFVSIIDLLMNIPQSELKDYIETK